MKFNRKNFVMHKLPLKMNAIKKGISFFKKKYIFFIPELYNNLVNESVSCHTSQNTFIILREILCDEHFDAYSVIYQYLTLGELAHAQNAIKAFGHIDRFIFVQKDTRSFRKIIRLIYFAYRSKLILSTSPLIPYKFKHKNQIHIALNYYSPFKSDLKWKLAANSIDYVISASSLSSYIDSQTSSIPINQYKVLGFPRNDYLIRPRFSRKHILNILGFDERKKYILYLPTHRVGNSQNAYADVLVPGVTNNIILDKLLGDNDSVMIIKGHSNEYSCNVLEYKNIVYLPLNYNFTLYDVMPHMDTFLLDYSSVYYDILLLGKKIIFNFIDFKEFNEARGFVFENIEDICLGEFAYDEKTLLKHLGNSQDKLTNSVDVGRYDLILNLTNKHKDSNSTGRVLNFIKEII